MKPYVIISDGQRIGVIGMSPALIKMWFSFGSMGLMFLAIVSIYFSRFKLKGFFKWLTAIIAYLFMIVAGLIMIFVVFSGPTPS